MKYVFDTGPFVSLFTNFYPSTFVTLWKNFDTLIAQGKIASTREAFREIEDQDDELRKWARSHKAVFTTPGAKEGKFVARIYSLAPSRRITGAARRRRCALPARRRLFST